MPCAGESRGSGGNSREDWHGQDRRRIQWRAVSRTSRSKRESSPSLGCRHSPRCIHGGSNGVYCVEKTPHRLFRKTHLLPTQTQPARFTKAEQRACSRRSHKRLTRGLLCRIRNPMSDAVPPPSATDESIPVTITGITGPAQIHNATITGVPGPSTATINVQSYDPNAEDEEDDDDDEGGGGDGPPRKKRGGHGRRKIEIEYIEDKIRRHITFSKRKAGISKKAYELSRLTGAQVRAPPCTSRGASVARSPATYPARAAATRTSLFCPPSSITPPTRFAFILARRYCCSSPLSEARSTRLRRPSCSLFSSTKTPNRSNAAAAPPRTLGSLAHAALLRFAHHPEASATSFAPEARARAPSPPPCTAVGRTCPLATMRRLLPDLPSSSSCASCAPSSSRGPLCACSLGAPLLLPCALCS